MPGFDTHSWGPHSDVDESIQKIIDSLNALRQGELAAFDASKITSGVIDIERIPAAAIEKLTQVPDEAARFALTAESVQIGDSVKQLDTGVMYIVVDTNNLDNESGYVEYTAGTAAKVPWGGVEGKPTTLEEYGLQTEADGRYTPGGYGVGGICPILAFADTKNGW